jgi:hypothetical protein
MMPTSVPRYASIDSADEDGSFTLAAPGRMELEICRKLLSFHTCRNVNIQQSYPFVRAPGIEVIHPSVELVAGAEKC